MNESQGTEQAQQQSTPTSGSKKLMRMLNNWIEKKVPLVFHMRDGNTIEARLVYYTRYDYVVQPGEESPAVLIHKHAVDYVERKR
jgi:sRNA-binding regulator protein Hfq